MNSTGYKSYIQWKNSRSGTAYIQYNDSKQLLNVAEKVNPPNPPTKKNNHSKPKTKSDKSKSRTKSDFFRKKYSKVLEKPLEKVINFQLVDEKTVDVKLGFFPEPNIISIFREHQMVYNTELKEWILPFTNYISLFNALTNLGEFKLNPIPANTLDILFERDKLEQLKFLNQPDANSKTKKITYTIDYTEDIKCSPRLNDLPKNLLKSLYRFQKQGILFGIKKYSRLLIADEMGVGKTIQAIGLSCLYQKDWPVLVICPSSLKFAWRDEITNWLREVIDKDDVQVIKHSKNDFKDDKKYYVISYDLSVRMVEKIIKKKFNYIIADEAHYLKSRTAKRTMCLTPILQRSKRVVLLTGTPILARPMEVFPLLHILRPDKFKGFKEFGTRYCDPKIIHFGLIDWSGASNMRELHSILNKLMIRRLKKDVLSQLPRKNRQKIEIATDSKVMKKLKLIMDKDTKKFEKLLGTQIDLDKLGINLDDFKTEKDQENEKKEKGDLKDMDEDESSLNKFGRAYLMTGEAKLPGIKDYVNYLVDNSCKFLVFAHHTEVLDAIEDVILQDKVGYIRIDGKVAIERRQELVNKFQNDEECLVAILSITACATGLTLTKASTVVFAELHFTPSIMCQAEDRAHRIGQDAECVNIHYLFGDSTLDVLLFRKLNEKQNIVSTTLDNKSKDLNVTKIKEQVGDFINMNGKQISVDDRKNITQIVDKSHGTIMRYLPSKSQINIKEQNLSNNNSKKFLLGSKEDNINNLNNDILADKEEKKEDEIKDELINSLNIHENNRRRKIIDEEEKTNENENNDNKDKENKKRKKKKRDKKKDKKNKSFDNQLDEKKENISNSNEENNFMNVKREEEKEIENIFAEDFKSDKAFEDKVLVDIFDFNNL